MQPPTRDEIEEAMIRHLKPLTAAQLVAVGTPTELERKQAFASALGQVSNCACLWALIFVCALTSRRTQVVEGGLLDSAGVDECEELLDRVTSAKSGESVARLFRVCLRVDRAR